MKYNSFTEKEEKALLPYQPPFLCDYQRLGYYFKRILQRAYNYSSEDICRVLGIKSKIVCFSVVIHQNYHKSQVEKLYQEIKKARKQEKKNDI